MSGDEFTGGCQCGSVRYRIRADHLTAYACHCRECQKQSASAFGISVPVMLSSLTIDGETASWRRPTDSGSHTICHFCAQCGSRVYHASENRPGMVTIKGGSLDCAVDLEPVAHIWTRSKQHWVVLPDGVPQWETQPQSQSEWMELLS
ncbi:GFA family protein [Erythrobacter sp. GH1-10]|uniref:GFA family protein n=1 Tax=Erythrobacter sp. GH1-10 TaxID=3349334 RepID=UPI0038780AA7